jgi:hypothetical protein
MKKSSYKEVDVALLQWFNQKQAEGLSVSGPMCAQKANFFHEALGLEGEFHSFIAWLTRFKQQYGTCGTAVQGERWSMMLQPICST